MHSLLAFIIVISIHIYFGHPAYKYLLPNGSKVPNPCTPELDDTWDRVGHRVFNAFADFAKQKNKFGEDFKSIQARVPLNLLWLECCKLDSDGDGMTNGRELGDTNCTWKIGDPNPKSETGLFHPGIPENANGSLTDSVRKEFC